MRRGSSRSEKVKKIFERFDTNHDGALNNQEMAALITSVNPKVRFNDHQIRAILDDIFRNYREFVDGGKGLTFQGLLRTYDDGASDVDRDFHALGIDPEPEGPEDMDPHKKHMIEAWAASPNQGIVFDDTCKLVDDLERLINRSKAKHQTKDDEILVKELGTLRSRADGARSGPEAFDAHMAMGRVLYDHGLFNEALASFKRACELTPSNVRSSFRAGNCLYVLGMHAEAEAEFLQALRAAEACPNQWAYLLPQIHVNLGIAFEGEGMLLNACEHYREAVAICPTHFRALKLLGSALLGVGEYKAAVEALEEAIYLNNYYAEAHCDLALALHALGDDENAVKEFQKAIDLKPSDVDTFYNLGGLYMDMGQYRTASETYDTVLSLRPNHWRAQLNRAVAQLGAGETKEAKLSLKHALKMTNRIELHDEVAHLKRIHKRKLKARNKNDDEAAFITVEPERFKTVGKKTTSRTKLAIALDVRAFQRTTRLDQCEVGFLWEEMSGREEKSIHKASLEIILHRLLDFLKPEAFACAIKAVNQKILAVLDGYETDRVDLGLFFATIAPLCGGSADERKQIAYESLLWQNGTNARVKSCDARNYIKLLRTIYMTSEISEFRGDNDDDSMVSLTNFAKMFDDREVGFSIMPTLLRLEACDRKRRGKHICATCRHPIIGSRFKEMKFSLCSRCYCDGKVPWTCKKEEYRFKEYSSVSEAVKLKCLWFGSKRTSSADF